MNKPLGCLSRSGLVAAVLALILLVAAGLLWGGRLFSPGPLSTRAGTELLGGVRSHAETGGRCAACHTALWSNETMSDRCVLCHTNVAAQLHDPTSLHSVVMRSGEIESCYDCHPEHRGSDAQLTMLDPGTFPHEVTGYSLVGHRQTAAGQPFACADCHGADPGHFDPARCAACHRDLDAAYLQAHEAAFGSDCLACHDGLDTYGASFDHARTAFPLAGRHASLACAGCHPGARSPADLQSTPQDCFACHQADDAHGGQFGQDCAVCHTPQDWEQATIDHSQTAFPLTGAHVKVACEGCHTGNVYRGTPQDCFACHQADDAHDGRLGQDCAACHTPQDWAQATINHGQTAFPLTGAHVEVTCEGCHADNVYRGTPQDCFACHQADDAHDGQFGPDCAACHTPQDWAQATIDHSQTAFPLIGAHVEVTCEACHVDSVYRGTPQDCFTCHQADDAHDGRLGQDCAACHTPEDWAQATIDHSQTAFPLVGAHVEVACEGCHADSVYRGTPQDCFACHRADDAHDGQFGPDCAACHTAEGWEGATFDHEQTAFPLTGTHVEVACQDCHANNVYRGTSLACVSCHDDPAFHRGLLGSECASCHNTSAWSPARYDRAHTFPLNHGEGGASPCVTCHPDSLAAYTCYGCHEHQPAEIEAEHREEGIADFQDCMRCHPTGQEEEGED